MFKNKRHIQHTTNIQTAVCFTLKPKNIFDMSDRASSMQVNIVASSWTSILFTKKYPSVIISRHSTCAAHSIHCLEHASIMNQVTYNTWLVSENPDSSIIYNSSYTMATTFWYVASKKQMNTVIKHVQMFTITNFWNMMPRDDLLPPTAGYRSKPSMEKSCNDVGRGRIGRYWAERERAK